MGGNPKSGTKEFMENTVGDLERHHEDATSEDGSSSKTVKLMFV
jgi:hypothetical protein